MVHFNNILREYGDCDIDMQASARNKTYHAMFDSCKIIAQLQLMLLPMLEQVLFILISSLLLCWQ